MLRTFILTLAFTLIYTTAKSVTIEQYYSNAEGKSGGILKATLHNIISVQTKVLSYSEVWEALKTTDEDPDDTNNVILLYTGWSYPKNNNGGGTTEWNREHTWAKSMGDFGTAAGPGTDIHHLRPTDVSVNSKRGNLYFDNGGTEYTDGSRYNGGDGVTGCLFDSDSWEPRDEVKGDVARMLFYMAVRYESGDMVDLELAEYSSSSGLHGKLSTLLAWHEQDPVSQWELDRNEKIYTIQGNRNPFINHPEYADLIWGENGNSSEKTEIFSEDFENGSLNQMTFYNVTGTSQTWEYSSYNSNYFAKMSGYDNGYFENEDWLINQSSIDLSGYTEISLSFSTMMKVYDGETTLKVLISKDYDGSSNPNNYTWTNITSEASFSSGNYALVTSGDIDLTNWTNQSIFVAFLFNSSSSGSNTWEIDDILIDGKAITSSIEQLDTNYIKIYPNPASKSINISLKESEFYSIKIYDQAGQCVISQKNYINNHTLNVSSLSNGIYVVKISDSKGDNFTQKLLVRQN